MSETSQPAIDTHIAARTADSLALPQMVCRHRDCRRKNRCSWFFQTTSEPCCLRNLTDDERRIFDTVYRDAYFAQGFLGTHPHYFERREGAQRARDDLAIAIARTSPRRWNWTEWDAARRAREKRMAAADRDRASEQESDV